MILVIIRTFFQKKKTIPEKVGNPDFNQHAIENNLFCVGQSKTISCYFPQKLQIFCTFRQLKSQIHITSFPPIESNKFLRKMYIFKDVILHLDKFYSSYNVIQRNLCLLCSEINISDSHSLTDRFKYVFQMNHLKNTVFIN